MFEDICKKDTQKEEKKKNVNVISKERLRYICEKAYHEGRTHQYTEDFPDVGPHFSENFEETESYKDIEEIIDV